MTGDVTHKNYYFGGVRLCGLTGTVLGPGLGLFGFFLGTGEGVDLLWGFTGTVLLGMILGIVFELAQLYIYYTCIQNFSSFDARLYF